MVGGLGCCLLWPVVLGLGLGEMAMVDGGGAVGVEAAMLDFLLCTVGRLAFVSFRTEGALTCRVNVVGTTVELFMDVVVSLGCVAFVIGFALSALRRAGFFRGFFLLGVVLEGWRLTAAVAAVSVATAISTYLRNSFFYAGSQ